MVKHVLQRISKFKPQECKNGAGEDKKTRYFPVIWSTANFLILVSVLWH